MSHLINYIRNNIDPPPRTDGLCPLCCKNKGTRFFKNKLVPIEMFGKIYHQHVTDHNMDICDECEKQICDYDNLYYG
mgnify:CR=1 FL=1